MKDINYYISRGFDTRTAEYFANGRRTITAVTPNSDFTLTLSFDNGEKRLYDLSPFLKASTVFAPLMDINNFNRVYIDDNNCIAWDIDPNIDSNIVWNNKIDLCSDSCYLDSIPAPK